MIIVVTTKEKRKGDGQMIDITSQEVGAKFDLNIREYVIN